QMAIFRRASRRCPASAVRITLLSLLATVLAAGSGAWAATAPSHRAAAKTRTPTATRSGEPVKIAIGEMITGGGAFYGDQLKKGKQLAAAEANAKGGVLRRPITLVIEDNASDNAQTVNLVRKWAQDPSFPAIISPTYQVNFEAGCQVANQLRVPYI